MIMKPLLFEADQAELVRARQKAVEFILLDQTTEASLRGRAVDRLLIPGLGQIAKLLRRNVADIDLVRRVRDCGIKVAQPRFQLLTQRSMRAYFAQRLGAVTNQVRDVR